MGRRTPKEFRNYNAYHDRGMMKWVTAYAMDELVKGIDQNRQEALKNNPTLPQMTPEEIDIKLTEAVSFNRPVKIQVHEKDKWGRQTDAIIGLFLGALSNGRLKIGDYWIQLEEIRHITVLHDDKWFQVTPFKEEALRVEEPTIQLVDEFNQDDSWIE